MPNEYYDPPYLDETEHSTVDHTGTPGIDPSAGVRYITGEEHGNSWVIFRNAGLEIQTGLAGSETALFTTITFDNVDVSLRESAGYEMILPSIDTPGIYTVVATAAWPTNQTGSRIVELYVFDESFFANFLTPVDCRLATDLPIVGPNQIQQGGNMTVWAYPDLVPYGLAMQLTQSSGGPLTIANNGIILQIQKIAELL